MISVQVVDKTELIQSALIYVEAKIFFSSDEIQAINAIEEFQPSIVILNYDFCKEQTTEYISFLLSASPESKVIIVADELSEEKIMSCLIAGAKGYQDINSLEYYANKLIKVVNAGEAWVTRRLVALLLNSFRVEYITE